MRCLGLICLLCTATLASHAAELKLIPEPQKLDLVPGEFVWSEQAGVVLAAPSRADDCFAAAELAAEVASCLNVRLSLRRPRAPHLPGAGDRRAHDRRAARRGLAGSARPGARRLLPAGAARPHHHRRERPGGDLLRQSRPSSSSSAPTPRAAPSPACASSTGRACRWRGYSDDISRGPIPNMELLQAPDPHHGRVQDEHAHLLHRARLQAREAPGHRAARRHHRRRGPRAVRLRRNATTWSWSATSSPSGTSTTSSRHEQYARPARDRERSSPRPRKRATSSWTTSTARSPRPTSRQLFNVNCDETYGLGEGPSKALAEKIGVGAGLPGAHEPHPRHPAGQVRQADDDVGRHRPAAPGHRAAARPGHRSCSRGATAPRPTTTRPSSPS